MSKIDLLKFAKHLGLFDLDIQYITSDIELLYKLMNKINEVAQSHNDLSDAVTEINNFINETILVDIDELKRTMLLKTQKVEITLENNVFKMGNTVLNFKDIRDLLKVSPNFVYVLHGDRAYLCSYIQDDEGLKEIRFQSVINSDNRVKSSCIYLISTDGINIYNTTVSDINNENQSNKVEEITDSTKDSTASSIRLLTN